MDSPELTAKDVFDHAIELIDPAERDGYVRQACAGDSGLREKVEALLQAYLSAGATTAEKPAVSSPPTSAYQPSDQTPPPTIDSVSQPPVLAQVVEGPGSLIGPYKLIQKLGEGGMGVVYMAEQEKPVRRRVALKIIKPGMDTVQVVARFEAERQALAIMDHLSIAKVFEAGATSTGRPYFVMELVQGEPITKFCDQRRMAPKDRLELFVAVCNAVQHAHQKGIIHRDLKPSNILVTMYEGKPLPKVIDFGIAKAINQQLTEQTMFTQLGQIVGTPEYMSPEQADINTTDIDTRSDIYSLGVVLYELLTGSTPLDKKRLRKAALSEMLRLIREEDLPKPSTKLSGSGDQLSSISALRRLEPGNLTRLVRGEIDWIVMKALDKDRARRYDSASGFGRDVQRYLSLEPVEACPPSRVYLFRKFVRKHRKALTTVTAFVILLVASIIGLTVGLIEIRSAWRETQTALVAERDARDRTRAALNTTTDGVIGDLLGKQIRLGNKGRAFLRKVQDHYRGFAEELGQTQEAKEVAAEGRLHVAVIGAFLGDNEEAETGFRAAIDQFRELAEEYPSNRDYPLQFAAAENELGLLLRQMNKLEQAEGVLTEVVAREEKLANEFPDVLLYRWKLATSENCLGLVWQSLGRRADAESAYHKAIAASERLTTAQPGNDEYRHVLADTQNNLGNLLVELGRQDAALAAYRRAIELQTKLVQEFADVPGYQIELARSHSSLAGYFYNLGSYPEAEAEYRLGIAGQEQLVADYPSVPQYRYELAGVLNDQGTLMRVTRKWDEAEKALRRAIQHFEKLPADFPDSQLNLAASNQNLGNVLRDGGKALVSLAAYDKAVALLEPMVARQGLQSNARLFLRNATCDRAIARSELGRQADAIADARQAASLAEELLKADGAAAPTPDAIYDGAAFFAQNARVKGDAALQEQFAKRAVELLTQAKNAGYFRDPRLVEKLKKDPDYDPVRQRADFQAFLRGL